MSIASSWYDVPDLPERSPYTDDPCSRDVIDRREWYGGAGSCMYCHNGVMDDRRCPMCHGTGRA